MKAPTDEMARKARAKQLRPRHPKYPGDTNCGLGALVVNLLVDHNHVRLESARPGEALLAVLTNERLLTRVQEVMFLQVGFLLKGPAA